jgi:hypothetical protein
MNVVKQLRLLGYRVTAKGADLALTYYGAGQPDPARVRPLLEELRQHKAEAITYLASEAAVPISRRSEAEEAAWWAATSIARGAPDLDPLAHIEAAYMALKASPTVKNVTAYALTAIAAGLPFFGGGDMDQGADGWYRWAGQERRKLARLPSINRRSP